MSHLIASKIIINDLDILKKAVSGFGGLTWNEGAKTFRWYVNSDQKVKAELESEHGQCEHSISIAGATYEIGVVKRKDGEGWSLVFDSYDHVAADRVGRQCEKVMAAYAEEYTRDFAYRHGFMVQEDIDLEGNKMLIMIDNS